MAVVVAIGLLAPAGAAARPRKPVVKIRAASDVTTTTAVLNGSVTPRAKGTTYAFQYGTTTLYGTSTPGTPVATGHGRVRVSVAIGGLAPATRYHFRLVAVNAHGVAHSADRTLRTHRQPLGVSLAATPNPVRPGGATVLAGVLTGTGNAGRQVVLQANPFPYTQGFVSVANPQVTSASGGFSFPVLSVSVNTQYRVLMPQRPEVTSPVVVVGTKVRIGTRVRARRGRHHHGHVRLSGRIRPAVDGTVVVVQKRHGGVWRNVGHTVARHASAGASRYAKRLRQRRGGRYRVLAFPQGAHVPNKGRTVRVRTRQLVRR